MRVIITAAGAGIGRAIAERLAADGATLAITDVDADALGVTQAALGLPAHAARVVNAADDAATAAFVADAVAAWGGLDALVNNAGIAGPTAGVDTITLSEWEETIAVNLTGQFIATRHAVPHLKAGGGGAIVNISSSAGRMGLPYRSPYSASKFGVVGFTMALAKELGPDHIRVNAVLPGIVEGPRIDRVIKARAETMGLSPDDMRDRFLQTTSMRKMVTVGNVADTVAFLLSDAGAAISGQAIGVDAGLETL